MSLLKRAGFKDISSLAQFINPKDISVLNKHDDKDKISKKISEKIKYLINEGLKDLISKKFCVDGYDNKKDFNDKKDKTGKFDIRLTNNPQPPELKDLYRLYQFIILNKRTTILEFGCGYSTLIISHALKNLRINLRENHLLDVSSI